MQLLHNPKKVYMRYGGYVYSGGGGGGTSQYRNTSSTSSSGGGSSGTSQDTKEDIALQNLYEIAQKNQNALSDKFSHGMDMYNISDQQIRKLAENERKEAMANSDDEWFEAQTNFQKAVDQNKRTAGNALTGSTLLNYLDTLETYDNKLDANTRTSLRKNLNEINKDEFEQLAANVNARNELANDTEYAFRQLANDYLAQRTNINPEKAHGQAWDDWSHVGDNFYNGNKTGAANYTRQPLLNESNAQQKANSLNTQTRPNQAAAGLNYFEDLLSNRNRRY